MALGISGGGENVDPVHIKWYFASTEKLMSMTLKYIYERNSYGKFYGR
jgi:hypothetical protein